MQLKTRTSEQVDVEESISDDKPKLFHGYCPLCVKQGHLNSACGISKPMTKRGRPVTENDILCAIDADPEYWKPWMRKHARRVHLKGRT